MCADHAIHRAMEEGPWLALELSTGHLMKLPPEVVLRRHAVILAPAREHRPRSYRLALIKSGRPEGPVWKRSTDRFRPRIPCVGSVLRVARARDPSVVPSETLRHPVHLRSHALPSVIWMHIHVTNTSTRPKKLTNETPMLVMSKNLMTRDCARRLVPKLQALEEVGITWQLPFYP